jgi:3-oxoacyl-[acyl-carrier protein] reductase
MNLSGKRVLLTGGSRGIGRGVVLGLAHAGATVLTCYRQEGPAVDSLSRELKEIGGDHQIVRADVTDPADVEQLVEQCQVQLGGLEVVVNNAGAISHVPFAELALPEWHRILDTSLTAAFLVTQKALPMLESGASVINIGSAAALKGIPLRAHYTAAKAGMIGLTRSLAKELGPRGIRVNLIAPGIIETEAASEMPPEAFAALQQRYQQMISLGRLGTPDEIAGAVIFLASDLSRFVTGETLTVDGGI